MVKIIKIENKFNDLKLRSEVIGIRNSLIRVSDIKVVGLRMNLLMF